MGRRRRASVAGTADRHAVELATKLGSALRDARIRHKLTQAQAAAKSGIAQTTWSKLELDRDPRYTLATWDRAAHAVGTTLNAYFPQTSAAGAPRDAAHLRNQELVLRTAAAGGWRGVPEAAIDRELVRSRHADVVLERSLGAEAAKEFALCEIADWIEDVGETVRDFQRRLAGLDRYAVARMRGDEQTPRTGGFWLLRATRRNRQLVAEHRNFFHARFPGSGRAWLAALGDAAPPMPEQPALLWVSVSGERLFPARLR